MTSFFEDYVVQNLIGEGGYGEVWSAVRKSDNMPVAIKCVKIKPGTEFIDHDEDGFLPLEIFLLKKVAHVPGVVKMLDFLVLDIKYFIVMEFVSEDLFSMRGHHGLSEELCKIIFRQILDTMIQLHRSGVFHGDMKLENVLCDRSDFTIKVIDLGNGNIFQPGYLRELKCTDHCCPPEWIKYGIHEAETTTVWTLGVLLFELCQGSLPFGNKRDILRGDLYFEKNISKEMKDFIRKCLRKHYNRWTLKKLQTHMWLEE